MKTEDVEMLADAVHSIGEAIKDVNEIIVDGRSGSVAIGISQALFQLAEAATEFSKDFKRYVDHIELT